MGTFAASRKPRNCGAGQPVRVQEREPDPSLGGKCAREGIFEGEIPNRAYSVLLWAVDTLENGKV